MARYLDQFDPADRHESTEALAAKTERLTEKLAKPKEEIAKLATIEAQVPASHDQKVSLTDPDSRSMATSGRGSGVVGYIVQVAVDTKHHLIVVHDVINVSNDRALLACVSVVCRPLKSDPENWGVTSWLWAQSGADFSPANPVNRDIYRENRPGPTI